jgi:periplasmic copper chaperone A
MNVRRLPLFAAAALLAAAPLSACGSGTAAEDTPAPAASTAAPRAALSITDPWVKAADSGMTGAFGTLVNGTGKPVTVVSATSSVAAKVELHEVVGQGGTTKMQPKQGGFVIPAGRSHALAPGGDHIMLMGLKQRVRPGTEVSLTLELGDGTVFTFTAVAKEFTGAKESYDPTHHG